MFACTILHSPAHIEPRSPTSSSRAADVWLGVAGSAPSVTLLNSTYLSGKLALRPFCVTADCDDGAPGKAEPSSQPAVRSRISKIAPKASDASIHTWSHS